MGDEADVMQAMEEMRQRPDDESGSSDTDRYGSSSDDEVVAASALQLQLQQGEEQPQRLQEPPEREKAPHRSATLPERAARKPTCVSGGGTARQRRMLERDGNSLASDQKAKRGRLGSSADARIHMR
eukprot:COSAG02_NODE_23_length_52893_cov_58.101868_43_plen_127_part_00